MKARIWYWRDSFASDGLMGYQWCVERGRLPALPKNGERATATHVLLKEVEVKEEGRRGLERVFYAMQGEVWSPNGEARKLIDGLGLSHTSMSVGDLVEVNGEYWMVDRMGFTRLAPAPRGRRGVSPPAG